MTRSYRELLAIPGARLFSATAFIGRFPIAMLGLGTVLLTAAAGSYERAGATAAAVMLGYAVAAPAAGRLTDRYGHARVLLGSAALHGVALAGLIILATARAPLGLVLPVASATGASRPPTGTLVRSRWVALLGDARRNPRGVTLTTALSYEAVLDEVVFISGPVVVTGLAVVVHPAAGLICCLLMTCGAAAALALQRGTDPGPRRGRTTTDASPATRTALANPGVVVITVIAIYLGLVIGAFDVIVVARAKTLGSAALAGPALACLGIASMISGLWYGARTWRARPETLWIRCLAAQFVGALPLLLANRLWSLVLTLLIAGLAIAPLSISGVLLLERLLPSTQLNEGMSVESTAMALGIAGGGWLAGTLVDAVGPYRVLGLPAAAAFAALATAVTCARWIDTSVPDTQRVEEHA
ncbi:MFS transporter [Streptomyces sp. NPDC014940]|uniref:MFS transporter n=1 Tax=Streptomyces sp. NPDC014940 TaxID=3364932 RepID=UPI00370353FC